MVLWHSEVISNRKETSCILLMNARWKSETPNCQQSQIQLRCYLVNGLTWYTLSKAFNGPNKTAITLIPPDVSGKDDKRSTGWKVFHSTWWRHQKETFSALLAICAENSSVTGEFPTQRPVTQSFDGFFDLRLNKRLTEQCRGWWFETPSSS